MSGEETTNRPVPSSREVVLEAETVSKRFAGVVALTDASLAVRAGEVHALVGENGAGKSTLIKVLTGLYQPDDGEVRYLGGPARFASPQDSRNAGVSTIYQEVNLIPLLSVAENIFLGREPRTRLGLVDRRAMNRSAREVLSSYGIELEVTRPLRSLGVGAQQMVAVARAVAVEARVVIMDEPTSSLEPREVSTLFEVIRRLQNNGIGVLYVSHRLSELYEICDEVTVLRDGRVVHTGPIADLPRIQLVALMLGRSISETRERGLTSFEGESTVEGSAPALVASGITRRTVLDDVSVIVRPGEIVGLGGLLGAGRSETARAIAGADPLDSGTVTVRGNTVRTGSVPRAMRAGIVMLPEDRKSDGVVPGLSVRENIALAALPNLSRYGIVSRRKQDEVVDRFVQRLRIKSSGPEQKVGELSGGNQQKVLLARLLARGPIALLLDEPTRGIDVGAKAEVQGLIDELAADGLAVVLISSEFEELLEGSDCVVVLRDGRVVATLRGDEVEEDTLMRSIAGETDTDD